MTNETTNLQAPAPLDTATYYTKEQRSQHAEKVAAYHASIRAQEERQRLTAEAAQAAANRAITEAEYEAAAYQRHQEKVAKEAAREAEARVKQEAKEAYLASFPDVAEIESRSEYLFLSEVAAWCAKGYTVDEHSIVSWLPGYYVARLNKPAPAKKVKQP